MGANNFGQLEEWPKHFSGCFLGGLAFWPRLRVQGELASSGRRAVWCDALASVVVRLGVQALTVGFGPQMRQVLLRFSLVLFLPHAGHMAGTPLASSEGAIISSSTLIRDGDAIG